MTDYSALSRWQSIGVFLFIGGCVLTILRSIIARPIIGTLGGDLATIIINTGPDDGRGWFSPDLGGLYAIAGATFFWPHSSPMTWAIGAASLSILIRQILAVTLASFEGQGDDADWILHRSASCIKAMFNLAIIQIFMMTLAWSGMHDYATSLSITILSLALLTLFQHRLARMFDVCPADGMLPFPGSSEWIALNADTIISRAARRRDLARTDIGPARWQMIGSQAGMRNWHGPRPFVIAGDPNALVPFLLSLCALFPGAAMWFYMLVSVIVGGTVQGRPIPRNAPRIEVDEASLFGREGHYAYKDFSSLEGRTPVITGRVVSLRRGVVEFPDHQPGQETESIRLLLRDGIAPPISPGDLVSIACHATSEIAGIDLTDCAPETPTAEAKR